MRAISRAGTVFVSVARADLLIVQVQIGMLASPQICCLPKPSPKPQSPSMSRGDNGQRCP
jgi:hypothetical protein